MGLCQYATLSSNSMPVSETNDHKSRSKYDLYKQMLTLRFKQALIHYVENERYRDSMSSTGEVIEEQMKCDSFSPQHAISDISAAMSSRLPLLHIILSQRFGIASNSTLLS